MATFIPGRPEPKKTCKVTFTNWDRTVECPPHTNLRQLAIEHDLPLYNGIARFFNCEGFGLCGTCAVEVKPQSAVSRKGALENLRFLQLKGNLRLACRLEVLDDIEVTKHEGLYGTKGYRQEVSKEELARRYEEGKTVEELAQEYETTPGRVVVLLEQAGVEFRRPGSAA